MSVILINIISFYKKIIQFYWCIRSIQFMVMEQSETFYQQKKFDAFVAQTFSNLIQLKREEKKEALIEFSIYKF